MIIYYLLSCLLVLGSYLQAENKDILLVYDKEVYVSSDEPDQNVYCYQKDSSCKVDVFLEAKAGYFIPTANQFRKAFSGAGIYELELTVRFPERLCFFVGADYYREKNPTKGNPAYSCSIEMVQLFAGLKYITSTWHSLQAYVGTGIQEAYVKNKNSAPALINEQHHWRPGALLETGILYVKTPLVLDVFLNYSWLIVPMNGSATKPVFVRHQNISGLSVGGGIGYNF